MQSPQLSRRQRSQRFSSAAARSALPYTASAWHCSRHVSTLSYKGREGEQRANIKYRVQLLWCFYPVLYTTGSDSGEMKGSTRCNAHKSLSASEQLFRWRECMCAQVPPPCRAEVEERTVFLFVHSVTLSSAITATQPSTTVATILVGCRAQRLALHCLSMALLKTRVYHHPQSAGRSMPQRDCYKDVNQLHLKCHHQRRKASCRGPH